MATPSRTLENAVLKHGKLLLSSLIVVLWMLETKSHASALRERVQVGICTGIFIHDMTLRYHHCPAKRWNCRANYSLFLQEGVTNPHTTSEFVPLVESKNIPCTTVSVFVFVTSVHIPKESRPVAKVCKERRRRFVDPNCSTVVWNWREEEMWVSGLALRIHFKNTPSRIPEKPPLQHWIRICVYNGLSHFAAIWMYSGLFTVSLPVFTNLQLHPK